MNTELEHINLFEGYINNSLSKEAKGSFEARIKSDSVFAQDFYQFKDMIQSIDLNGEKIVKNELQDVETELELAGFFEEKEAQQAKIRKIGFTRQRWWAIAAGLLFLIFGTWFILQPPTTNNNFATYAKVDRDIASMKTVGFGEVNKGQKKIIANALELYKEGKYNSSNDLLSSIQNYKSELVNFYRALNYAGLEDFDKAIELLQPITELEAHDLKDPVRWYLVLVYAEIDTKSKEEIREMLLEIKNNASPEYQKKATNYLEKTK